MADRKYPNRPFPGVGAFVIGSKGILLIKRDKEPGKGLWAIPGGVIEIGETQEEAVVREVKEETGVEIEVEELNSTADLIQYDSDGMVVFHFVLNHYFARALTESTHRESPESEVQWCHPDQLPDGIAPRIAEMIADIRERILAVMTGTSTSEELD